MLDQVMHEKRVESVASAVTGVLQAGRLGIAAIGHGLAMARDLDVKHAIKQVDRLLSNELLNVWELFAVWVPYVVGSRTEIVVALDWTDFDKDDQSTIALHLITRHGRATPLLWKTVFKSELAGMRNEHEDMLLIRLREVLPPGVQVTVLADRGFGDSKKYTLHEKLCFDYVIRFRENIEVEDHDGESRVAAEWVPLSGRPKMLREAWVTAERNPVPAVVCVQAKGMKDAWCLATSRDDLTGAGIVKLYGKRFTIEENFRDQKDLHFGMGLSTTRIKSPERRDRLLFVSALAVALLTMLGAAGESLGLDRMLRANTVKYRTHSLFRQGSMLYDLLPNMRASRKTPLLRRFGEMMLEQTFCRQAFGWI
jgi:hypothetical protein